MKKIFLSLSILVASLVSFAQSEEKEKTLLDLPVYEKFVAEFSLSDAHNDKAKVIIMRAQNLANKAEGNAERVAEAVEQMTTEFEGLVEDNMLPKLRGFFEKLENELK